MPDQGVRYRRLSLPVYEQLSLDESSELLSSVLPRLRIGNRRFLTQESSHTSHRTIQLNVAPENEVQDVLRNVDGLGQISCNRILTQRMLGGDFLGEGDFNRRVKGITFSRFQGLCEANDVSISLKPSKGKHHIVQRPRQGIRYLDVVTFFGSSAIKKKDASPKKEGCIIVATWNTGRMSRNGMYYEKKVQHLFRFVRDSEVEVLCLQELCTGVAADISIRLSQELDSPWEVFRGEDDSRYVSDPSLALVFRKDSVRICTNMKKGLPNVDITSSFIRRPQIAFLKHISDENSMAMLLHVHLNQTDPRDEIKGVGSIVEMLKSLASENSLLPMVLVVGDFNLNSDSLAFESLRRARLVELVRPESVNEEVTHPYKVLRGATTVGGHWYDNIWISECCRWRVRDAWTFDFGGRGQSFLQGGYEFAAERRARSSDHVPIAMRLVLKLREHSEGG